MRGEERRGEKKRKQAREAVFPQPSCSSVCVSLSSYWQRGEARRGEVEGEDDEEAKDESEVPDEEDQHKEVEEEEIED